tara:strand:- start:2705 stop:3403 length:699 start_codon:yes stop_codon:yes gene_type:complete
MNRRIAIIEDEEAIRENYADALKKQGYQVNTYADRPSAEKAFAVRLPDLAIVDIGLGEEMDGGFHLCQSLRQQSPTLPIMFLTARDNDIDTVCGLRMGADDYLTKDISLMHLIARVSAIFRRIDALDKPATKQDEIYVDQLSMNTERMSATWQQRNVGLSLTEFWMVYSLAKHAGHVKSRDHLMQESNMVVDDSTITSHIKRIRKKFMAIDPHFNAIDTVYGLGYRWKHDQS